MISPPLSFHTTPSSPSTPKLTMSDSSTSKSCVRKKKYRPAIPVSAEIRNHCHIYLDEKLYNSALTLLTDLVTSGTTHPKSLESPAFAPVPFHIEIVSALLVHPLHTNQAPRNERAGLASRSISFLRSLLATLGPLNANLAQAFSLAPPQTPSSRRNRISGYDDNESDEDEEHIKGIVANKGRIRRSAKDFWHIVGWAFNCSVVHPERWKYWKVWLDYMLDVLDADWNERAVQDEENDSLESTTGGQHSDAEFRFKMLKSSLLVNYLLDVRQRTSVAKRVVGAVFTDGGPEDLKKYPEVFPNETQEAKATTYQKRKRDDELDVGFGDCGSERGEEEEEEEEEDDDDDEASASPPALQDRSRAAVNGGSVNPDPWMGGPESILLRQRVLSLLSRAAAKFPDCFVDCKELYHIFYENMITLPVPTFSLLISPSTSSQFPVVVFVSLTQVLLSCLLPNSAPRPRSVSNLDDDTINQEILERCFLPFTASTSSTDDNAKVSILIENLLRLFLRSCRVEYTPNLVAAIETGVTARETKAKNDKRRRENSAAKKEEERDRVWLEASGWRLRSLLAWVKKVHDDGL